MYKAFYGLSDNPFSIAPNPHYLFLSDRHREALTHLTYGLGETGGFVLLTGEVGTGKTTVSRCLLNQLPDNTDTAFILNPSLTELELLATLCDELHIDYEAKPSLKQLTDLLSQFLLKNHENGRNTVLIIDEAQHLRAEVLEQLRLLTNLETDTKKLLQVILIGQPELQQLLKRQELRQLAQRITARYHLLPLSMPEVGLYVQHRLQVAGRYEPLFSARALKVLHKHSGGIPRLINLLCERSLMAGYAQSTLPIDHKMVNLAAAEVFGYEPQSRSLFWPALTATALLSTFAAGLMMFSSNDFAAVSQVVKQYAGMEQRSMSIDDQAIANQAAPVEEQTPTSVQTIDETTQSYQPSAHRASQQISAVQSIQSQAKTVIKTVPEEVAFEAGQHPNLDLVTEMPTQHDVVNTPLPSTVDQLESFDSPERAAAQQNVLQQNEPLVAYEDSTSPSQVDTSLSQAPTQTEEQLALMNAIDSSRDIDVAYAALFGIWGKTPIINVAPCDAAEQQGLDCYQQQGNWLSIKRLNYPAVVSLVGDDEQSFYGTVVSLEAEQLLLQLGEQQLWVSRDWFTRHFTGTFEILWQGPKGASQEIGRNSSAGNIQWLENSLSRIDNTAPRLIAQFDNQLERRLKAFQRRHGLKADGIAGSQTLVKLNLFLSTDGPRLRQGELL